MLETAPTLSNTAFAPDCRLIEQPEFQAKLSESSNAFPDDVFWEICKKRVIVPNCLIHCLWTKMMRKFLLFVIFCILSNSVIAGDFTYQARPTLQGLPDGFGKDFCSLCGCCSQTLDLDMKKFRVLQAEPGSAYVIDERAADVIKSLPSLGVEEGSNLMQSIIDGQSLKSTADFCAECRCCTPGETFGLTKINPDHLKNSHIIGKYGLITPK